MDGEGLELQACDAVQALHVVMLLCQQIPAALRVRLQWFVEQHVDIINDKIVRAVCSS